MPRLRSCPRAGPAPAPTEQKTVGTPAAKGGLGTDERSSRAKRHVLDGVVVVVAVVMVAASSNSSCSTGNGTGTVR